MKLVLLGTGGYFPTSARHTACFLLPEVGVVLDAGTGMCRIGDYLQTDRLDVFLSHAHLDHVAGLTYLVNVVPQEVLRQTTVHGEPAKLAAVREHLFAPHIFPVAPAFRFEPLRPSVPLPAGGTLTHFPLHHPGGSRGFRLDWPGRSLAYVTDTTAAVDADYVEHLRGVDLLLHECHFADDRDNRPAVTGHSWLIPVAQLAAAAGVGRLVLIHFNPQLDPPRDLNLPAARAIFPNTNRATDATEVQF